MRDNTRFFIPSSQIKSDLQNQQEIEEKKNFLYIKIIEQIYAVLKDSARFS